MNINTRTSRKQIEAAIKALSTQQIVEEFEATNIRIVKLIPGTPEYKMVVKIRGFSMNELSRRDYKALISWFQSKEKSPRRFYL